MARIRGLELLFSLVKDKIQSKQDCVVAALHCLLTNEGLQCVGTGEEFSDEDARSTTELLPTQWNENQEVYTLRYISKDAKNRYLVKFVKAGNMMLLNIALNEDKTAAMSTNIDRIVSDDFKIYSSAYNDLDSLKDAFQKDIVEKLLKKPSPTSPSSSTAPPRVCPQPVPRPRMPIPPDFGNRPLMGGGGGGRAAFPDVGGSDLDPFGRGGGGGMLLDPPNFGVPRRGFGPGLPRGAVPPGARFDPFGPPIGGPGRFRPNPDHFKPPDDFDDFI